jgi:colicin import membrane protein
VRAAQWSSLQSKIANNKSSKSYFLLSSVFLGLFLMITSSGADRSFLELLTGKKNEEVSFQSFVQVDVVGLPDHQANEKANPLLPEVAKPETKTLPTKESVKSDPELMEEKALKKDKEKKKEMEKKREDEKAMKLALEEAEREQALKGLQTKSGEKGRGKLKGNILSEGTSTTGVVGTAKDKYIGILTESIKQQFNIFSWQQKKGLVAEVRLVLLPNGKVKWRKIVKASKDIMYDSAVLQAIDDAQPFPVPEDKSLLKDEITINFRP